MGSSSSATMIRPRREYVMLMVSCLFLCPSFFLLQRHEKVGPSYCTIAHTILFYYIVYSINPPRVRKEQECRILFCMTVSHSVISRHSSCHSVHSVLQSKRRQARRPVAPYITIFSDPHRGLLLVSKPQLNGTILARYGSFQDKDLTSSSIGLLRYGLKRNQSSGLSSSKTKLVYPQNPKTVTTGQYYE